MSIFVPANLTKELKRLEELGCTLSKAAFHFAIGDMVKVNGKNEFQQTGKDAGLYCDLTMPAGWRVECQTYFGGVLVDAEGCIVAEVLLPHRCRPDAKIDFTHFGKWYGSAQLYRAREMIEETKVLVDRKDNIIEIMNSLRDSTGMVADELRALVAAL